jgi:hypothetical protein
VGGVDSRTGQCWCTFALRTLADELSPVCATYRYVLGHEGEPLHTAVPLHSEQHADMSLPRPPSCQP